MSSIVFFSKGEKECEKVQFVVKFSNLRDGSGLQSTNKRIESAELIVSKSWSMIPQIQ